MGRERKTVTPVRNKCRMNYTETQLSGERAEHSIFLFQQNVSGRLSPDVSVNEGVPLTLKILSMWKVTLQT